MGYVSESESLRLQWKLDLVNLITVDTFSISSTTILFIVFHGQCCARIMDYAFPLVSPIRLFGLKI